MSTGRGGIWGERLTATVLECAATQGKDHTSIDANGVWMLLVGCDTALVVVDKESLLAEVERLICVEVRADNDRALRSVYAMDKVGRLYAGVVLLEMPRSDGGRTNRTSPGKRVRTYGVHDSRFPFSMAKVAQARALAEPREGSRRR